MNYRKWNILTHRYLGYYFFGLTFIYSISGVAVNHIEEWNPSYITTRKNISFTPLKNSEDINEKEVKEIFSRLELDNKFNAENIFYPEENTIQIIVSESEKISLDTQKNTADYEKISRRPVLHLFNFLHLNEPKKFWTWYADFYAISLLIIAITGMFMKKGKEGFYGKGGILAVVGMIIPVIFLYFYY